MFDNRSKITCYNFSIDFSKPIGFICNLANEISLLIDGNFNLTNLFEESFIEKIGFKFENTEDGLLNTDIDELTVLIADYFSNSFLENINLNNSEILLIHKSSKTLFIYNKNDSNDIVKNAKEFIKSTMYTQGIFNNVLINIKNADLKASLLKSIKIQYRELFDNCISIKEKINIDLPFFSEHILDFDKVEKNIIDENDLWINLEKFKKDLSLTINPTSDVFIIETKDETDQVLPLGIAYGGLVFTVSPLRVLPFINTESLLDYYWTQLQYVFIKQDVKPKPYSSKVLTDFKDKMTDDGLSKVLSYLNNNIYVNEEIIDEQNQYAPFFDEVYKVEKLAQLTNYSFFVSSVHGKTALGIYLNEKPKDSTSFNLLHWGMNDNGKFSNFRSVLPPENQSLSKVKALKPELTFYFITNYFEDLLDVAIKDAKCNYIKNFELFVNNTTLGEIDFLIKSNNRLCFIEAKTKLTKEYIEKFQDSASKLIGAFSHIKVDLEFYLISAFSDEKSIETQRYFIDESSKENYNTKRKDIFTVPYYFSVPIPSQKGKKIVCISEPEFSNLKAIIAEICQE